MERIEEKSGQDPLGVLIRAIDNIKPRVEVKSRRVGGATYQVPVEINRARQLALAITLADSVFAARRGCRWSKPRAGVAGCLQQPGQLHQEARRHAQDGAGQQGLCALCMVDVFIVL
jgi:hypothetical protein